VSVELDSLVGIFLTPFLLHSSCSVEQGVSWATIGNHWQPKIWLWCLASYFSVDFLASWTVLSVVSVICLSICIGCIVA